MVTHCVAQLTVRYQSVRPPIVACFDVPHASSDGGLVLLKAVDERLRLTETVAAGLTDPRQPGKIEHSLLDLVQQRVFAWVRAISMATTPPGWPTTRCTS